jgi:hypothetical protein
MPGKIEYYQKRLSYTELSKKLSPAEGIVK